MYIKVALFTPPFTNLTYSIPSWWPQEGMSLFAPGVRVAVPLGTSLRAGMIVQCSVDLDTFLAPLSSVASPAVVSSGDPKNVHIKPLAFPLESTPLFEASYLYMIQQLAVRQCRDEGNILSHVLPSGLRTIAVRVRHFAGKKPRVWAIKSLYAASEEQRCAVAEGLFTGHTDFLPPRTDAAEGEMCVLNVDPPWPVRPQAKRQIAVLEYLLDHGPKGSVSRRALVRALGAECHSVLESLVKHNLVVVRPADDGDMHSEADDGAEGNAHLLPPPSEHTFVYSSAQQKALAAFATALDMCEAKSMAQTHLLYGVTGSGKTAVYLALARMCKERGRSMLLLAPEVALALKLKRDASLALPDMPVFLYHGYQGAKRREELFRHMAERTKKGMPPCVIVGTRSALFLPLPPVGAIVLDEEHDASFKQDEKFVYQAKEVAWFHATQYAAILVLASATPDMKTFYAAQQGRVPMQVMPDRVGGGTLPNIRLVSISGQKGSYTGAHAGSSKNIQTGGDSILAQESEIALKETLARGEQAVILLNRRGYAPTMYCLSCNQVARCPHCAIGLTYHKGREKLVCHYCGYTATFPTICTHCKGLHYLPMGQGTEKLAEYLAVVLAPHKVLRLDRDSTKREGHMERILDSFARQEAHVLVGTQMLSKGHHFPHVTLALIPDGDMGLNMPDYRAAERTFQLLIQSAGRAGRGARAGSVIIQTRDVNHYCWKYIQSADFEGFYADEIARREKRRYPPFIHLALIRISFAMDWEEGNAAIALLGAELRRLGRECQVQVLGPAPAPLTVLRGQKRFHCLLKSKDWAAIRHMYTHASTLVDKKNIRLFLDIDPVNML